LKKGDGRLLAIASLIAAFASVILVASVSVLLIVGLWKLHARTAPRFPVKLSELPRFEQNISERRANG
jgi:hypothetical protein